MFKTTILAISTIAILGAASPAMAGAFGDDDPSWAADRFQASLHQRGVDAVSVAEWGDYVRADVKLPSGGIEFQYFNADTFERVTF